MTVYARSDVASVSISPHHGGCGRTHSRPAPGGKPDPLWALECPTCENFLRFDPCWAVTPVDVPETPDEVKAREDGEKRGEQERLAAIGTYLAADQEFKAMFLQLMGGMAAPAGTVQGQVECPSGHGNRAGAKFCGECGEPVSRREPAGALPPPEMPPPPPENTPAPSEVAAAPGQAAQCVDCGAVIVRPPGKRGAMPKRCPACKGS